MTERLWADIDLGALAHNIAECRRVVGEGVDVMGLVKANAYGHGAVPVARALAGMGITRLCVATPGEALELREGGLEGEVLVLSGTIPTEAETILAARATVVVSSADIARGLAQRATAAGAELGVHLKVDTGMGRLGVSVAGAPDLAQLIHDLPGLRLDGLMTHFPVAEDDAAFTRGQVALFGKVVERIRGRGLDVPVRHTANSAAVAAFPRSHFNAVRPGIGIYGCDPLPPDRRTMDLRPVLSLRARVVLIKHYERGETVGYGRTFTVNDQFVGAVVPVGYADGYSRRLSNRGEMILRGRRAPVVGRVSMDQTVIDVTDIPEAREGDVVTVIGRDGDAEITVEQIAFLTETIPNEVLTGIGPRVRRVYA